MVDFPTGIPDFASMVPGNPLATGHGAVTQAAGMNRALLNARALATKLGPGTGAPALGQLLAGAATAGQTVWAGRTAGATLLVAASNASAAARATASYVCDGTADQVEINAALAALPAGGGSVRLSEGTFTLAAPIGTAKANSQLVGSGVDATTLRVVNAGGASVNGTMVQLAHASCSLSFLTVDGNKANNAAQTAMTLVAAFAADILVDTVRITNSPAYGSSTTGANARYMNCIADGCVLQGFILRSSGEAERVLALHCIARACADGFYVDSGPVTLVGCVAISNTRYGFACGASVRMIGCEAVSNVDSGFLAGGQWVSVIGCRALLNGTSGIQVTGTDVLVGGCHVIQNAQHGIYVTAARVQVVGCRVIDNSTFSNFGFIGIVLNGTTDAFVDGNLVRQGSASANKQAQGISVVNSTNVLLGHNDVHNGGASAGLADSGTNTRRTVKQQLNYVAATNLLDGAAIAAGTWTNVGTAQTFRVDSPTSLVTIALHGHLMLVAGSASEFSSRLVLDGAAVYKLGGMYFSTAQVWCNPFGGGNTVTIADLSVGDHTVIAQIATNIAGNAYLRPTGVNEPYGIQVVEHFR